MKDAPGGGFVEPKPPPESIPEEAFTRQIEAALGKVDRESALRDLVYSWFSDGLDEGQAIGVLVRFRDRLYEERREADEDVVDDILSYLEGWCASNARICCPS